MTTKAFRTAMEIVRAEEEARRRRPEVPRREKRLKTEIEQWTDKTVTGAFSLADYVGRGKLVKLRISSPTSAFSVQMKLDGEDLINDEWANLTEELAAYQEDSTYYLHIEDKAFNESLLVTVTPDQTTTFNLLYCEVLVEK
jgi:hypothetical protein